MSVMPLPRPVCRAPSARNAPPNCLPTLASPGSSAGRRGDCPAASSSGWHSPARWRAIRPLLFLDEPTASLDPAATKAIEDIVRAVSARGVKVVMSTHDLGQAKRLAGDVVLLHRGRLIESGPATEFFANPRTQEARTFIAGELLV